MMGTSGFWLLEAAQQIVEYKKTYRAITFYST